MTTKKFNSVLCALGLVAVFACTEEIAPVAPEVPEVTVPENLVEMTITASQDDTKSTFDGKTIGWELTDVVAVYDGVQKREFIVTSIDEQTGAATLKGYVDADATAFQAVYPYSAAGDKLPADGKINISVPATQKLEEGAVVAPGALVSVGEILEGKISFKNVVSLLKVKVTEEMTSVSVKGVKYENIAGDATATVAAVTSEGGAANIVLKPVGEKFVAGYYYIALLPTAFADGFTVAYRKESGLAVLKSGAAVEFPANGGFDVTGKDLSTLTWLTNPIMSESDLKTYLANQDSYAGEAVSLGKDITLTEAWTPVALTGNLDGAGYTISGLAVEAANAAGMFTLVDTDASLKNVTVEGSITLKGSTAATYAGLAAEVKGVVYKVINKASVTVATDATNAIYAGGIVGRLVAGGQVIESDNHGAVLLNGSTANSYIGGIVGYMAADSGCVDDCDNYGEVKSADNNCQAIGGISGMVQGGNVLSCINNGSVIATNSVPGNSYMAGVIGYLQNRSGKTILISDCHNKGVITVGTGNIMGVSGIVGALHRWYNASTEISGCVNDKAISVTPLNTTFYLGGIVAQIPGSTSPDIQNTIKECTNNGALTLASSSRTAVSGKSSYVGGIAAETHVNVLIDACVNTGNLTSNDLFTTNFVGGILAYAYETTNVSGCTNSGALGVDTGSEVENSNFVGGIVGCAKDNATISGNTNTATADISVKAKGTNGSDKIAVGGIVGLSNDGGNIVVKENRNYGSVLSDTPNTWCPAGGVVACVRGNLNSSDNINFGDIEVKSTDATLDDVFCGGIVGLFNMAGTTQGAETATLLRDKSFGYIKSSGRVGLIFAASAWSNMGKIVIDACVLGGKITGKVSGNVVRSELEIKADNFASNLWSYYYTKDNTKVVFENRRNCTFGSASTYDK